jgi:hypothetical protein
LFLASPGPKPIHFRQTVTQRGQRSFSQNPGEHRIQRKGSVRSRLLVLTFNARLKTARRIIERMNGVHSMHVYEVPRKDHRGFESTREFVNVVTSLP